MQPEQEAGEDGEVANRYTHYESKHQHIWKIKWGGEKQEVTKEKKKKKKKTVMKDKNLRWKDKNGFFIPVKNPETCFKNLYKLGTITQ